MYMSNYFKILPFFNNLVKIKIEGTPLNLGFSESAGFKKKKGIHGRTCGKMSF